MGRQRNAHLSWLYAPPPLAAAVDTLTGYGCDPRLGAMLYHAGEDGDAIATATAALLAAMIEEPPRSGSPDIRDHFQRPLPHWTARAPVARPVRGRRWCLMTR